MRFAFIFASGFVSLCQPLSSIFSQICGHSSSLNWNVNSGSIFLSFIRSNSHSWNAVLNFPSSKGLLSTGSFLFCLLEPDDAMSDFWKVKVLRLVMSGGIRLGLDRVWLGELYFESEKFEEVVAGM